MSRLRSLLWPVPPSVAAVVFVGVLGAAVLVSRDHTAALVADWARLSSEFHEGLTFAGPVAGMGALWVALRVNARRGMLVPLTAARAGTALAVRHVLVVTAVSTAAFVAGLVPALSDAAARATAGGMDVLVVLSVLPTMAFYVALGYLIGTLLPPLVAVLAGLPVLLGVLAIGGLGGARWWSVAPVWGYGHASAGHYENPVMTGFRIAFFTATVICLVIAAATWLERRSPVTARHSAVGLVVLSVPVLVAGLAVARPVQPVLRDFDALRVCQLVDAVEVCVHAAHRPLLDDLAEVTSQTLAAAGPLASEVAQIHDASLNTSEFPLERIRVPLFTFDPDHWQNIAAEELSRWLSGHMRCPTPRGEVEDIQNSAGAIRDWIWIRSGYAIDEWRLHSYVGDFSERLDEIGSDRVYEWMAQNRDAILACEVTAERRP